MKEDKLEQFVIDNRDLFDDMEPDPKVRERIFKEDNKVKKLTLPKYDWKGIIWKAAAVVIIFVISYFVHDIINNTNRPDGFDDKFVVVDTTNQKTQMWSSRG